VGEILVGDLETDGFDPSQIWVVGILNLETDEYKSYTGDDIAEGLCRLADADLVVGHNFKKYDAAVIEKLSHGVIKIDHDKIDDTWELSRELFPELPNHKLETWGEILGSPKIKYNKGFAKFHPEMLPYCEQDVRLNADVYRTFIAEMARSA
jgi:DNA polymerase III alpha subunit (gram-positive type)